MKRIPTQIAAVAIVLALLPAVSTATELAVAVDGDAVQQSEPPPASTPAEAAAATNQAEADPLGTAQKLIMAIRSGNWGPAIALAIMFLVAGVRWGLGKWVPWLKTKPGGYVLGYGSAVALAIAGALEGGAGVSLGLFTTALMTAWATTGGWSAAKDFVTWVTGKVQGDADAG